MALAQDRSCYPAAHFDGLNVPNAHVPVVRGMDLVA